MTNTARTPENPAGQDKAKAPSLGNHCLVFAGPIENLYVYGANALVEPLRLCLPDWQGRVISKTEQNPGTLPNSIGVEPLSAQQSPSDQAGFRVLCDLLPQGKFDCGDPLEAANALAGALTGSYIRQDNRLLQVHAASATFTLASLSGQLLFLGDSQAGKSSLALQLARRGQRLFGDDRLAICLNQNPLQAMSLGVGPKIRLPLPSDMEPAQVAFLKQHQVAEREAVAHLNLPSDTLAPLGERSPLLGLVLLNRLESEDISQNQGESLEPLDKASLLRHLLPKCLAPALSAQALVMACQKLVEQVPAWTLTYSNSAQAADHLIAHFES